MSLPAESGFYDNVGLAGGTVLMFKTDISVIICNYIYIISQVYY